MERCIEIQIPTAVWVYIMNYIYIVNIYMNLFSGLTPFCARLSVSHNTCRALLISGVNSIGTFTHTHTNTHTHTHTLISLLERIVSRLLNKCGYTIYYITHVIQLPGTILILPLSILDLFCDILWSLQIMNLVCSLCEFFYPFVHMIPCSGWKDRKIHINCKLNSHCTLCSSGV